MYNNIYMCMCLLVYSYISLLTTEIISKAGGYAINSSASSAE